MAFQNLNIGGFELRFASSRSTAGVSSSGTRTIALTPQSGRALFLLSVELFSASEGVVSAVIANVPEISDNGQFFSPGLYVPVPTPLITSGMQVVLSSTNSASETIAVVFKYVETSINVLGNDTVLREMQEIIAKQRAGDVASRVITRKQLGSSGTNDLVTATTTAGALLAANPNRVRVLLYNTGALPVFIGTSTSVTSSNGVPLTAGDFREIDDYTGVIAGITASSSTAIIVEEIVW